MTSPNRRGVAELTAAVPPVARPRIIKTASARRGADRLRSRRSTRAVAYQIIVAASANPTC